MAGSCSEAAAVAGEAGAGPLVDRHSDIRRADGLVVQSDGHLEIADGEGRARRPPSRARRACSSAAC